MIKDHKIFGDQGEVIAGEFLRQEGFEIIERKYTNDYGEIDFIAQEGIYLCFIEVKSRRGDDCGNPLEAVDRSKQNKIIRTARNYLLELDSDDFYMRFDVMSVECDEKRKPKITLIRDAFEV